MNTKELIEKAVENLNRVRQLNLNITGTLSLSDNDSVFYDTYTDNIYIKCFEEDFYAGGGSMSPYYNAEGKIMKYDEFTQVHKH